MTSWDAQQYLKFANERTQPARDLVARVAVEQPQRVIDLGCGPGNSTAVLRERWSKASIMGLDSSPAMIAAARAQYPDGEWLLGDVASWQSDTPVDVVFANAVLQWLPDHGHLFPQLIEQIAPGGALAVQMPTNYESPVHQAIWQAADEPVWRDRLVNARGALVRERPAFYYDLLRPQVDRIEIWETEYIHVLDGPQAIVEWVRGTGMRPFLQALPDDNARTSFTALVLAAVTNAYPRQRDGMVLFPFRRLFLIAYR